MTHISVLNRERARPRLERIAKLKQAGVSQSDIARILGLSRERIRQLVADAKRQGLLTDETK